MEKLSRVKKYEDLRKQIENNAIGADELPQEKLQDYAQRLNEIDPSIFKKVDITKQDGPYTPERERKVSAPYEPVDNTMGDFRNEYLDDFINEVREYNIKKGTRENENTQIDILNQLHAVTRTKRDDFIEPIVDDVAASDVTSTASMSKEEIAAEVHNLLQDTMQLNTPLPMQEHTRFAPTDPHVQTKEHSPFISSIQQQEPMLEPMQEQTNSMNFESLQPITFSRNEQMEHSSNHETTPPQNTDIVSPFIERKTKPSVVPTHEEQIEIEREKRLQQKLVEETQQLRVQLNEYEDDLNDLSEGVEKTNKMLNIILGCLILALLVIIGIIIYWIIGAGGIV